MTIFEPDFYLWHLLYYNVLRVQKQQSSNGPAKIIPDSELIKAYTLSRGREDPFCVTAVCLFIASQLRSKGIAQFTFLGENYDCFRIRQIGER